MISENVESAWRRRRSGIGIIMACVAWHQRRRHRGIMASSMRNIGGA